MIKKKQGKKVHAQCAPIRKQILTTTIAVFDHVQVKYVTDKFELQGYVQL